MNSPRLVAAKALIRCEQGGYSQLVLDAALKASGLTGRDSSLATALFYGALERKITLDHCIARYTKKPPDEQVRAVLRIAVFSLLYLDRVAAHAVVDEAVKSIRALRRTSAAGMVNAVLRAFLRDGCQIPPTEGDAAEQLAVSCSCSKDVATRLIDWVGNEKAREILEQAMGRPPVFLRVNTLKTNRSALINILDEQGIKAFAVEEYPESLAVTGDAAHTKAFKDGLFHIQDLSSQKTAMLMEAKPGSRLLDVCAAPGSKSFVMAQGSGEILHGRKIGSPFLMQPEHQLLCTVFGFSHADQCLFDFGGQHGKYVFFLCGAHNFLLMRDRKNPSAPFSPGKLV